MLSRHPCRPGSSRPSQRVVSASSCSPGQPVREHEQYEEKHKEYGHERVVGAHVDGDERLENAKNQPGGKNAHHGAKARKHHDKESKQRIAQPDLWYRGVNGPHEKPRHDGYSTRKSVG